MSADALAGLPGGPWLARGLRDVRAGRSSAEALLVAMAWPRIVPLGLLDRVDVEALRERGEADVDFEVRAYRALLSELGRDAHARFLALSAELESALNALEREARTL